MNIDLQRVALRNGALYLQPERPTERPTDSANPKALSKSTIYCLTELINHGFTVDERALRMLNVLSPEDKADVLKGVKEVFGTELNWTPLVRGWSEPTHETLADHIITFYYNILKAGEDTTDDAVELPCGHFIPRGTFDMSRYTGCPFCGTPFETNKQVNFGQASHLKELTGWDYTDLSRYYENLLGSNIPLSAGQYDDLKVLLPLLPYPDVDVKMRETATVVASYMLNTGKHTDKIGSLLRTPADVLRMIWYVTTKQLRLVRPATLMRAAIKSVYYEGPLAVRNAEIKTASELKLYFNRRQCRWIASAINATELSAEMAYESMHPQRGMWVRVIRAARLTEYAKRKGFEHLREILDVFYREDYTVFQSHVDKAVKEADFTRAFELLKQRPGTFARQLFAMMLRTNPYTVLAEFRKVLLQLPLRLVYSLGNAAEAYFLPIDGTRTITTITGASVTVPINPNLLSCPDDERKNLIEAIVNLTLDALKQRYALTPMPGKKIYIDPTLFSVVLPVGDRSQVLDGVLTVPQGTKFPVLGDSVRIFLQWGKGLKAQPMDLDISAKIFYADKVEPCYYGNLTTVGAKHSGDMRAIPDEVGTAEYIELDIPQLIKAGAKYVTFVANQYTAGTLQPNAMVGWMDSAFPMKIDQETGVAYDPSCVQYMVKIPDNLLTKGLIFGVLDVARRDIIWLAAPFDGRTVIDVNYLMVVGYLHRLSKKVTVGKALMAMAEARGMQIVRMHEIDDDTLVCDQRWAYNIAQVTALLIPNDPE